MGHIEKEKPTKAALYTIKSGLLPILHNPLK